MAAHNLSKLSQAIKSCVESYGREISAQINDISQTFQDERLTQEQEKLSKSWPLFRPHGLNTIVDDIHYEVRKWLSPCNPDIIHSKSCRNHHNGTSGWFLNGPLEKLIESTSDYAAMLLLQGICEFSTRDGTK